jgi:2,4-dienoyl-CoA reductase-like NADH-dependent reductase (Old Yellow Enzyme family)/thioredoxin reductase
MCTGRPRTARDASRRSPMASLTSTVVPSATAKDSDLRTTEVGLFDPFEIRGLVLPNRVLMAPMEKNLCTSDGVMTQRYVDYLVARARGGVGLLRVEATYVDPVGKGRPFQCGAHADHVIPGLKQMTDAVHAAGGRVSLELAHCGRQTNTRVSGFQPVAPSAVPCALSGGYLPRALTQEEIAAIVDRFVAAASRGQEAGLDAIEIHGASGYLLNAFMSPYTNLREDEYGGNLANRMRFPLEVVRAVRAAVGDGMPLLYRMSGHDYVDGGLTETDTVPFAQALEQAGIDLIDVSAGTYESITVTQPPMEAAPGALLDLAAAIKSAVTVPVATAGKLSALDVAEQALGAGKVDFISIARGLHADPELLLKAREGRLDEARRCISCAECVAFLNIDEPAYCAINPASIRELELASSPASTARTVAVVGGGPAGLEAARAARLAGHRVTVYEASSSLGGRVRQGAVATGRQDFAEPVRFLAREMERLGVSVHLATEVDTDFLERLDPDVVVVATGARPTSPPIPGNDRAHVESATDYLARASQNTQPVADQPAVVIGANWIGCHAADVLVTQGYAVTVIDTHDALANDMGMQQGMVLRDRVADACALRLQTSVENIGAAAVTVWDSVSGQQFDVPATFVLIASRMESVRALADALRGRIRGRVHVIGDAAKPRKLADALLDGARLGASL